MTPATAVGLLAPVADGRRVAPSLLFSRRQSMARYASALLAHGQREQALDWARRAVNAPAEDVRSQVIAARCWPRRWPPAGASRRRWPRRGGGPPGVRHRAAQRAAAADVLLADDPPVGRDRRDGPSGRTGGAASPVRGAGDLDPVDPGNITDRTGSSADLGDSALSAGPLVRSASMGMPWASRCRPAGRAGSAQSPLASPTTVRSTGRISDEAAAFGRGLDDRGVRRAGAGDWVRSG